jgi:transketolase
MRPADAVETEFMMRVAMTLNAPSAICLTRQKVPMLPVERSTIAECVKGAYVVLDCPNPGFLFIATGSEVSLALATARLMGDEQVRVVSMPCWELFEQQPIEYRSYVLPQAIVKRVSFEAGSTTGWQKYTGMNGLNIGLDHFGDSAPAEVLADYYGFTPKKVAARIAGHQF